MKKILEVLQYGEMDIRFNTDVDVTKNPDEVLKVNTSVLFAMLTNLWGGNEISVIAMIRALAIADIAASVNPKEMVDMLYEAASGMKASLAEAQTAFEKSGGKIQIFGPGIKPVRSKS